MRKRTPEAEKKRLGRPSYRTFHNRIGFHISAEVHQQMKDLAKIRNILLEEIYRDALSQFLELRASKSASYQYIRPPARPMTRHVTIEMEEILWQTIRYAVVDDRCRIGEVFETAARLYLAKQGTKFE